MNNSLEPLKASALTNMEFGQLMKSHLSELSAIDQELITDQPYKDYVLQITDKFYSYESGLKQIQKNEETEKIKFADDVRDKAVDAFSKALKLYAASDEPAEVEASRVLRILYSAFKDLTNLSYGAESISIDKLVNDLESVQYADKVELLQIGRYVARLKNSNENFKTLFKGRTVTTAFTESFDLKTIRTELLAIYNEFTAYVLSMAKAHKTPLFISALALLNTTRKYYSDLLARRSTGKPTPPAT